ncbi:ParB/RepB/Spo0J family partition protein [Patescibacteria group bacterium]|nr:MAG: ParB/RepB/Spo0J family partition protein [Patescibacteria group bacterium]
MSTVQKSLGRGLGSLLGVKTNSDQIIKPSYPEVLGNGALVIPIDKIRRNPYQPRETFNPEKLEELADSIRVHGIIEPLVASKDGDGSYELISGERRLRAAKRAGLTEVPVVLKELGRRDKLEIAIIENVQREDLNPIERGKSYQRLVDEFRYGQEEVAKRVGKSRESVANSLRLLKLPEKIQEYIRTGKLSEGHGKILLGIAEPSKQIAYAEVILRDRLTVRQLSDSVSPSGKNRPSNKISKNPNLAIHEDKLRSALGTKVELSGTESKGKISIEYYSAEDLHGIVNKIIND